MAPSGFGSNPLSNLCEFCASSWPPHRAEIEVEPEPRIIGHDEVRSATKISRQFCGNAPCKNACTCSYERCTFEGELSFLIQVFRYQSSKGGRSARRRSSSSLFNSSRAAKHRPRAFASFGSSTACTRRIAAFVWPSPRKDKMQSLTPSIAPRPDAEQSRTWVTLSLHT